MDAAPHQQHETFASYLARYYIATKGYSVETVPEAAPLANACDIVLTGMNGPSLEIICIIDCEAQPGKRFEWTGEEVSQIARECLKYCGSIELSTMPVCIRIYEIGPGLDVADRRARLSALGNHTFTKAQISGWIFDTTSRTVWTSMPFKGRFVGRPALERLLREERMPDADLQASTVAEAPAKPPFVTYALLAIITAIFACEMFFPLDSDKLEPGIATLIAMGGSSWSLTVQQSEWYRGISAVFLHGGVKHFLINALVLYWAGRSLEPLIGHAWFGAVYAVAAICGSLLSLAMNPTSIVSVGASGAIMGLMTAAFVCSFRFPKGPTRTHLQLLSLQVLIPSLIPLAPAVGGAKVDFGAHLGGAIGGALVGGLMLVVWSREVALPPLRGVAAAVAAIWTAGAVYAGAVLGPVYASTHRAQAAHAFLMPDSDLPRDNVTGSRRAATLAIKYPRDPRAHYYRAIEAMQRADWAETEKALRAALAEKDILIHLLPADFHDDLQGMLALTLSERGKAAEAKAVAKPVCTRFEAWSDATRATFKRLCS